jgi:GNAT superfamily N-acetyltransferase
MPSERSSLRPGDKSLKMDAIAEACSAVGFNSIPSWMRPYAVLSNGEKFRVDLARRLLELPDPIVVDEFSSVVDRQVAKIASHAVQKFIRRNKRQFVAVGCHYDVIEYLNPDWVLDMATRSYTRRLLQRRPAISCTIGRLPYAAWSVFAKHHYLTGALHRAAKCFGLWCEGVLAAFCAVLPVAVSSGDHKGEAIWRISRVVTLPDYQGLGLAFVLTEAIGSEYRAKGTRFRNYPAHPSFVRAHDRSPNWALVKKPGTHSTINTKGTTAAGAMGGRPCAVFEYVGPPADKLVLLA